MFVIYPDPYSTPAYRIGTFTTKAVAGNLKIDDAWSGKAVDYFNERFGAGNWLITKNGRQAISLALEQLNLPKDKSVTILTPSNNFYISGCVTGTISNYTRWNRQADSDTCAYFVNHEFGYLYTEIEKLKSANLPIIEDCCTTFFSQDAVKKIGLYGDFSVFSFPKFFNIQIGGLLVGKEVGLNEKLKSATNVSEVEKRYILKVVGFELSQEKKLLEKRREIFDYASEQFLELGFTMRFPNKSGEVPSVLLLNNNGIIHDLQKHKEFLYLHGIQNSVFYGEDAFFIPCHQNLEKEDIDYFRYVTENFINS
jgi:dTDP-4-amino-4,6-dideoxygalactose transaminase